MKWDGSTAGSAALFWGAAVLDDIIGIIILTVVSSLKDPSISIISILIKIGLYIIFNGRPGSGHHCLKTHGGGI